MDHAGVRAEAAKAKERPNIIATMRKMRATRMRTVTKTTTTTITPTFTIFSAVNLLPDGVGDAPEEEASQAAAAAAVVVDPVGVALEETAGVGSEVAVAAAAEEEEAEAAVAAMMNFSNTSSRCGKKRPGTQLSWQNKRTRLVARNNRWKNYSVPPSCRARTRA